MNMNKRWSKRDFMALQDTGFTCRYPFSFSTEISRSMIDIGVGDSQSRDWIDCAVGPSQPMYQDSSTSMSQEITSNEENSIVNKMNMASVSIYESMNSASSSSAATDGHNGKFYFQQRRILGEIAIVPNSSSIIEENTISKDRCVPISDKPSGSPFLDNAGYSQQRCPNEEQQVHTAKRLHMQPILRIGLSKKSRVPPLHPRPIHKNL